MYTFIKTALFILIFSTTAYPQALDRTHVNYRNPLQHGATCDATTLNAAITAAGSNKETLVITKTDRAKVNCTWTLASNITTNVNTNTYIPAGVIISPNTGVTATFNGPVQIDDVESLQGAGSFVFNYPQTRGVFSFISSGCSPAIPGSGVTFSTFACAGTLTLGTIALNVNQGAAGVGPLSGGDGTYWLAITVRTTDTPSGWTRQSGTHYIWQKSATKLANPVGGILFLRVTVSGGNITATDDMRIASEYQAATGIVVVTDPLWGAKGDGVTLDTTAIRAAINALPGWIEPPSTLEKPNGTVFFPCGTYLVDASIFTKLRRYIRIQGAARTCTVIKANGTAVTPLATVLDSGSIEFADISVQGFAGSTVPGVILNSTTYCIFRNFQVEAFDIGVQLKKGGGTGSFGNSFYHSRIVGMRINIDAQAESNTLSLYDVQFGLPGTQTGLKYVDSAGLKISAGDCSAVSVVCVDLDSTTASPELEMGATLNGVYFESNTASAGDIRVGNTQTVNGVSMFGGRHTGGAGNLTPLNAVRAKGLTFNGVTVSGSYTNTAPVLGTVVNYSALGNQRKNTSILDNRLQDVRFGLSGGQAVTFLGASVALLNFGASLGTLAVGTADISISDGLVGDVAVATPDAEPGSAEGLVWRARVVSVAAGIATVRITLVNPTAGTITLTNRNWQVVIFRTAP